MKIGFLGPAYPLRGGIAQFIEIMAEKLSENHEVKIFSFKKQYPKILFPGKEQLEKSERKTHSEIIRILTPYNPFTFYSTAKAIKIWNPDILILKYWIPFFAPAFGIVLRLINKNTRIIYIIDNIEFHEKWFLANLLTRFALKPAAKLITMSHSVYDDALNLFPNKIVINSFHPTYPHFNNHKFSMESAKRKLNLSEKKVILFFGYIKPYKGLDILIKAFPLIQNKISNAHLLIVGEVYGTDKVYLDLIAKLHLQNQITFIRKFVKNEDVEQYFKSADVLALPYKQATQSGVAQVGYNFGIGAVVTPVGGLPELVINEKTGMISATLSELDFAKAIVDYFSLDKEELKKNINKENSRYSWKKFLEYI